jgi:hypothetical protein
LVGASVTNYSVNFNNYGILDISYGTLTNSGTITGSTGEIIIDPSGSISNLGAFIIQDDCSFNNYGLFTNALDASFSNSSVNFNNSGIMDISYGTLTNSGIITSSSGNFIIDPSGSISNLGTFIISDDCSFNNYGLFTNASVDASFTNSSSHFNNYGILDISYGTLTNSGTGIITGSKGNFIIDASGSISNSGTFIIPLDCSFNNYGLFTNAFGASFTNYSVNLYTRKLFNNYGSLTNLGTIYVKSLSSDKTVFSTLNILSGGSFTNSGTIILSTLDNNDYQNSVINNYSTNFINNNLIKTSSTCFLYNNGTIYNNTSGGTFGNNSFLTFYNGINVNSTAKFYNYQGTLECDRGIYNYGTIYNGYNGTDSTIESSITANVNGLINYSGTIYNFRGNTITNNNSFINNAVIENYGTFKINDNNNSTQKITNSGIIYNSTIDASFNINKNSTNTGSIYNYKSGTITIASGKTLTNSGNIINANGTGDCGTATINYSGIYGDISGNIILFGCPNPIPIPIP